MIHYSEAVKLLEDYADDRLRQVIQPFKVSLCDAHGFVSAENVCSPEDFPPFDASMFDGFAVRSLECGEVSEDQPVDLLVQGHAFAGDVVSDEQYPEASAYGVSTGAQIPPFFDAVVKKEDVSRCEHTSHGNAASIQLNSPAVLGQNIRYTGSDVSAGQVILEKGERIDLQHFPLLSALGLRELKVFRRPRIGILSTGNEIVDCLSSEPLPKGKVRNATSAFLAVILQGMGCDVILYQNMRDSALEVARFLQETALRQCDILITTGGVSVGQRDFLETAISDLGGDLLFHRVLMRPGKPSLAASVANGDGGRETLVLGFPGNPMATVSACRFLFTPLLRRIFSMQPERTVRVRLGNPVVKPEGFTSFLLGKLTQTDEGLSVFAFAEQDSFRVLPLARANAWVMLPEVCKGGTVGDLVEVLPLFADGFLRNALV